MDYFQVIFWDQSIRKKKFIDTSFKIYTFGHMMLTTSILVTV